MATVTIHELPGLFRAADRSSLDAQKSFIRLVRADLCLIVVGAVITSWAVSFTELRTIFALFGAVSLIAGLALTVFVLQTKPDKQWYGARAVAESVKTIAWRYMMGAEPYQKSLPEPQADARFSRELQEILRERSGITGALGGHDSAANQITETMRQVRSADLDHRKSVYLSDRIQDQRAWYGNKAQANARSSTWWLIAVGASQLAGATAAIALVRWPGLDFNAASVFAALAAAFMAWLQVKQHQELAHAYGLAAHELGIVEIRARHVTTEEEFSSFVSDTENAISREHTMWVARRDVVS